MPLDPATGIYTPLNERDPRKIQFVTLSILVGAGKSVPVSIRGDIADYFNMVPLADGGGAFTERSLARTTRSVYASLKDTTGAASQGTTSNKFMLPGKVGDRGKGKIITVPTELTSTRGNIRTCRICFPSVANLAAISNFLAKECKLHVPTYFLSPTGTKRAVALLPTGKDPNSDLPLQLSLAL